MRCLITGGAGYVGSLVAWSLVEHGFEVVVLDDLSSGHRELLPKSVRLVVGDLRDRTLLDSLLSSGFDAVLHFAARIEAGVSVNQPLEFYSVNFIGSLKLVEAMIANGVQRLVYSSSAAVYGSPKQIPIPESHPTNPVSPYGASKLFVERMLKDVAQAHDFKFVALRYFNAAGADKALRTGELHSPETHLIPRLLMTAAGITEAFEVYGTDYNTRDGTAERDFIHVQDLANAHLAALELLVHDKFTNQAFNVGTGKGYTVNEVLKAVETVTKRKLKVNKRPRRVGDPPRLIADASRFINATGWRPHIVDIEEIVHDAWAWHQKAGFGKPI